MSASQVHGTSRQQNKRVYFTLEFRILLRFILFVNKILYGNNNVKKAFKAQINNLDHGSHIFFTVGYESRKDPRVKSKNFQKQNYTLKCLNLLRHDFLTFPTMT